MRKSATMFPEKHLTIYRRLVATRSTLFRLQAGAASNAESDNGN